MKHVSHFLAIVVMTLFAQVDSDGAIASFEVDTGKTGQLVRWVIGEKVIVDNTAPSCPLEVNFADGEAAVFVPGKHQRENGAVHMEGDLVGKTCRIPVRLSYLPEEGGHALRLRLSLHRAAGEAAPVASASWVLPLALNPRKRVWFATDYHLEWDERYFYQFTHGPSGGALSRPDRNEWAFFGLDCLGPEGFRLWKAESETTSPLVMAEGPQAAPLLQLYDRQGGISLKVSGAGKPFPASLQVQARGSGTLRVDLHHPTTLHTSANDLFRQPYEIVLRAYDSEQQTLADRERLRANHPTTPRPLPESVLQEPAWLQETPLAPLQYVTGGYPLPKGRFLNVEALRVEAGGSRVAHQARPLAFWPDGSIKWVLLSFPFDPAAAKATSESGDDGPRITLRNGKSLPVRIDADLTAPPLEPESALRVESTQEAVTLTDGPLAITLSKGANWLRALTWEGSSLLAPGSDERLAYTDYLLAPAKVTAWSHAIEGGKPDLGALVVDSLKLEESGPLRAVVRLEGMTRNEEPTRIVLRLELLAGTHTVRFAHTAIFRFKDPRKTFLQAMGLRLPLANAPTQIDGFGLPAGHPPERLTLLQATSTHSATLATHGNTTETLARAGRLQGWGAAHGDRWIMTGAIRNFWQQAPSALSVDRQRPAFEFELWPASAPLMDVRRYSNYPHRAQLESVPTREDWVESDYYSQEPFTGISRTHEFLLALQPSDANVTSATLAADFQSPPLLYAGWQHYKTSNVLLPTPERESWPRSWEAWTNLTTFWLWHQAVHHWHGFWHFGDLRHYFQGGYGWIAAPEDLVEALASLDTASSTSLPKSKRIRDYFPPNDWAYDNGRWGWSNTEGLPNLFLLHEYLRHGNRSVYFAAEALARHSRDVVTRQEGLWLGRGTRHGVQHWSDGNHDQRQTTATEYRLHHLLSGDARTRDVIDHLYREVYSQRPLHVAAWHSGRLGGLLFHWELTGDRQEADQLERYINLFISDDGLYTEPHAKFPGPVAAAAPEQLNSTDMFFHTFGAMHALIEYHQLTGSEPLRKALLRMADAILEKTEVAELIRTGSISSRHIFWPVLAFAGTHAPDPAPYRARLREFLKAGAWQLQYQTVTRNPGHWSGPSGRLGKNGNVPLSFFWNNWASYIAASAGTQEIWTPEIETAFNSVEESGAPSRRFRLSWQEAFDNAPGLEDYLATQQPWSIPEKRSLQRVKGHRARGD